MKRLISFILCFCFLVGLTSCNEVGVSSPIEKTIAVEYASFAETACEAYVDEGYTKVTYNSASDVALAVENNKVDFGVVDELELGGLLKSERNIKEKEKCDLSIDYCAYFSSDNKALQQSFNEAIKELYNNGTMGKIIAAHSSGVPYTSDEADNVNGSLTMLCDPHYKYRVYINNNEEIVGLDVDIAREICNYLGYDLNIVSVDFDEMFLKLDDGEGDFVISACEANPEREAYCLLSDSYFTLDFYLIERK